MKRLALIIMLATAAGGATFTSGNPTTTNNDDSCDIALLPAATLLLPYFEVDVTAAQTVARTTLFTVVNTSQFPQIARVTIWTDLAYPVLNFNLFLTGYDVQAINLYDVLGPRSTIVSAVGPSSNVAPGNRSMPNNSNPNFAATASADCAILPGPIPTFLGNEIRSALTTGHNTACGSARIGNTHANAIGYITIDVVKTCAPTLPNSAAYYDELLYDNVLTGDFQQINPNPTTGNYAGGNPLVHIRAIPEGGPAGAIVPTNLPYTFYDHYTPQTAAKIDRRQPLPASFAARFIQGGPSAFNSNYLIWREGVTGDNSTCSDYAKNFNQQSMSVADIVRFDEHENATLIAGCPPILCVPFVPVLPSTSGLATADTLFPPSSLIADVGGWMYLNLTNHAQTRASQNWVTVSMAAEGRYSVMFDATMLANGCTAAPLVPATIGPGPNTTP